MNKFDNANLNRSRRDDSFIALDNNFTTADAASGVRVKKVIANKTATNGFDISSSHKLGKIVPGQIRVSHNMQTGR